MKNRIVLTGIFLTALSIAIFTGVNCGEDSTTNTVVTSEAPAVYQKIYGATDVYVEGDYVVIKSNGRPDEVIINRLKLSNDQVLKFENLNNEHRKQAEELQFASKKLHDEYFGLLKTDNPDTVKASGLLAELGKNQQQLDKVTYEHVRKIKDICDKDQKLLFNTFIDEIAASFKPPIHKK